MSDVVVPIRKRPQLPTFTEAANILAEMALVADVQEIEDQAAGIMEYARQSKDPALLEQATRIRFEATRNVGRIIREMQKRGELHDRHSGAKKSGSSGETRLTLADLGLTKKASFNAQWLLDLSKREYERRVESIVKKMVRSLGAVFRQALDDERKAALFARGEIAPGLYVGDFRRWSPKVIKDESIELVFTDPPYDRDSLNLYGSAAKEAARILKPGGSFIAYSGQINMLDAATLMSKHLRYFWVGAVMHAAGETMMRKLGIYAGWKPLLWFVKDHRGDAQTYIHDVVSGGREKEVHPWQQAISEAAHFIEPLTSKDGTVVDFFVGGGTTLVAAKKLGRRYIGFEKNPEVAKSAEERLRS